MEMYQASRSPCRYKDIVLVETHNKGKKRTYLSMTTAGVWEAMIMGRWLRVGGVRLRRE
jgi:hypothetical protein